MARSSLDMRKTSDTRFKVLTTVIAASVSVAIVYLSAAAQPAGSNKIAERELKAEAAKVLWNPL